MKNSSSQWRTSRTNAGARGRKRNDCLLLGHDNSLCKAEREQRAQRRLRRAAPISRQARLDHAICHATQLPNGTTLYPLWGFVSE